MPGKPTPHCVSVISSPAPLVSPESLYDPGGVGSGVGITVAPAHVSPPARILMGAEVRPGVGVGEGDLLTAVGGVGRRPVGNLANCSSRGFPSISTEMPPRRTRSFPTVLIG
jgi:hypothetical protein